MEGHAGLGNPAATCKGAGGMGERRYRNSAILWPSLVLKKASSDRLDGGLGEDYSGSPCKLKPGKFDKAPAHGLAFLVYTTHHHMHPTPQPARVARTSPHLTQLCEDPSDGRADFLSQGAAGAFPLYYEVPAIPRTEPWTS